ncbi:MAG: hypothetical protein IT555_08595 [Acetobacteraceae bacterium]|nr:hypothetical protein [Acetobacteraceae bacterium]
MIPAGRSGDHRGMKQKARMFFFRKKEPKNFRSLRVQPDPQPHAKMNKVFLLLFLQKKKTFLPPLRPRAGFATLHPATGAPT